MTQVRGLYYVLLGHFQSDPIEERFGWFRQLHGGNYYVSVRQLFDSERKLRAPSLIKYSDCSVFDISCRESDQSSSLIDESLFQFVSNEPVPLPDQFDLNAIFYVAGALARSELKSRNCSSCKNALFPKSRHSTIASTEVVFANRLK